MSDSFDTSSDSDFDDAVTTAASRISLGDEVKPSFWSTNTGGAAPTTTNANTGSAFGASKTLSSEEFAAAAQNLLQNLDFNECGRATPTRRITSLTAPSGISAPKPSTTSTVTTPPRTSTAEALESISFAKLEEDIKKWSLELEDQEKIFINEAMQINDVDRMLIPNGLMIAEVNEAVQKVKNDQEQLEQDIDILLAQQKKLDDLPDFLDMFDQVLIENRWCGVINTERQSMYGDAKNLEKKVYKMSEDLKEVIQHFSKTIDEDNKDPIGSLLYEHMASMQWLDDTASKISTIVDLVKANIGSYPGKFETG